MVTRLDQTYKSARALDRYLGASEVLRGRFCGKSTSSGGLLARTGIGRCGYSGYSGYSGRYSGTVRWFSVAGGRDGGNDDDRGAGDDGGDSSTSSSVWKFFTGGGRDEGKGSPSSTQKESDQQEDATRSADGSKVNGHKSAGHSEGSNYLITSSPEQRYREVLSIPVYRRPLFPGVIMPVMVSDTRVIKELIDIRKQGAQAYVGTFLSTKGGDSTGMGFEAGMEGENEPGMHDGDGRRLMHDLGHAEDEGLSGHRSRASNYDVSTLYEIGTFAQVHTVVPHDQGAQLLLLGHRRLRRTGVAQDDPLRCTVQHIKDEPYDKNDDMLKATTMELISTLKELLHMHPLYNEQMRNFIQFGADFHDPSRLADLAASLTSGDGVALQMVLEELRVPERIEQSLVLLRKEANLLQLQQDIGKRVEEKISKDQRRYFLMEQLKSIKKELGIEKDDKTALVQKFKERIGMGEGDGSREGAGGLLLPDTARKVIEEELAKLEGLEPASSEFNVTRNYLDWLTSLPWGKYGEERLDVGAAREVLDEDHYGLSDVKDRILEFIAVGKLRGSTQGKILCFVGPPGVGKTSIGKSIARSLDRAYYRFSVGGLSDVAEIKGHRRTYVGAMPGKMVQCLKSTGTSNPFVLIDEIDKLGRGYQGDPASALLELLDPEQNGSFLDHYLDVPIDLSKVLFVCTANQLDTIPGPLLDRMEVIQVSGYTGDEKVSIARTYLEPQANLDAGIPKGAVRLQDEALRTLVDDYAREAGVRSLKKLIEKVYRKAAFKLVDQNLLGDIPEASLAPETEEDAAGPVEAKDPDGGTSHNGKNGSSSMIPGSNNPSKSLDEQRSKWPVFEEPLLVVGVDELVDYVGHPPYPSDKIYQNETPLGVVTGLAWTASGGATLYIEAASVEKGDGKGGLRATGQLGDVMKESTTIAHTYARRIFEEKFPENPFFSNHSLHIHVPAGATPKDGPSAGCAVVTALLSLAMDKPVRPDIAMTGEITLTGKVLPIGGVKEKALAAKRSEITTIILPEGNRRDWDELSDDVKEGLQPHFFETYEKLFELAFGDPASE